MKLKIKRAFDLDVQTVQNINNIKKKTGLNPSKIVDKAIANYLKRCEAKDKNNFKH